MSLWTTSQSLFGDEIILRSIDWLENFPWRNGSSISKKNDKYEITLHLKDFKPEEITVKTCDGFIVVKGQHEERKDEYGYVSRQFVRRYALPEGCRPETVESKFCSNGMLIIRAIREPIPKIDVVIPVSHEGLDSVKSKI